MKTKHFFNAVFAALIAVIFLVLAGCASNGATTGGAATVDGDPGATVAAQLAADLNALKEGSATVSGDMVTLTGGVRLENTVLIVSSGVTLDLTKETLRLANNATLAVNGTVNAKAEGVTIDSMATNPAAINGSGTIYLKSNGSLLYIGSEKKLTLDGVTLVGMKDNNDVLVQVIGGEFVLKSGKITGNTHIGDHFGEGGGVKVSRGGTFTMEGGEISGNVADGKTGGAGGGAQVLFEPGTVFTMKGGTISGNSASRGGGVSVAGGTFILEGGTISGNTAADPNSAELLSSALRGSAKWGIGGTYTKGGVSQTGGSEITSTNDTLIAIPAK